MPDPTPAVVPAGERQDLQQTARETGERMGRQDALLGEHANHLDKINGSIGDLAASMANLATSSAVTAAAIKQIEVTLVTKVDAIDTRVGHAEDWIAERRGGTEVAQRRQGVSTQWWLAIFAAVVAGSGIFVTVVLTIVLLLANGKL